MHGVLCARQTPREEGSEARWERDRGLMGIHDLGEPQRWYAPAVEVPIPAVY